MNIETKEVWKIRPRINEGERVGHEYWYANGETIGFHGSRADGSAFLGHVRYDNTQHSHPHPRFNEAGNQVLYTSDITGYCNVYLADIPAFDSLPYLHKIKN